VITVTDRSAWEWPMSEGEWRNVYCEMDYAWLHLQFAEDVCYLHLYMKKWGSGVLRAMRADMEELRWLVRSYGGVRIVGGVGYTGRELDKWKRLVQLIGFSEPKMMTISDKPICITVMEV